MKNIYVLILLFINLTAYSQFENTAYTNKPVATRLDTLKTELRHLNNNIESLTLSIKEIKTLTNTSSKLSYKLVNLSEESSKSAEKTKELTNKLIELGELNNSLQQNMKSLNAELVNFARISNDNTVKNERSSKILFWLTLVLGIIAFIELPEKIEKFISWIKKIISNQ